MRKLLVYILLLVCVGTVSAQKKWSYNLGFGGELKSGNVNSFIFSNTGGVERNDSLLALDAHYDIVYGMKDHEVYDKGLTASLTFDVWQHDKFSPFVSASYINNKFKGFEFKTSFLVGAKLRLYTIPGKCDYSISAAYVSDWVEYFSDDILQDEHGRLKPQVSRLSLRFKVKQRISDIVYLKHITFYQPSLMEMRGFQSFRDDYIITSVTTFENRIGKKLSLDINFNYEYRSVVPEGKKNTDIVTSATLKLKF